MAYPEIVPSTGQILNLTNRYAPTFSGFLALLIPALFGAFAYDIVDGITQNPVFTILLGLAIAIMTRSTSVSISTAGLVIASIGIAQYVRQLTIKLESE